MTQVRHLLLFTVICFFVQLKKVVAWRYGVMVVENTTKTDQLFCVIFYPSIANLTSNRTEAQRFPLSKILDLGETNTCDEDELSDLAIEGRIPYISTANKTFPNNCSIAERVENLEKYKAIAVLANGTVNVAFNASLYDTNITVASISDKAKILELQESEPHANFFLYSPEARKRAFDMSLVIILLMAVFTVMAGSFWSGYVKHNLRTKEHSSRGRPEHTLENAAAVKPQDGSRDEELSVQVSPLLVIVFVFFMCVMLVLLYFFYNQLVYVIMGMFCLASSMGMYSCLEPLVMASYKLPKLPVLKLPRCNLYLCVLQMELRQFLLLLISLGTAATWFIFRKEEWAWILQDFLGILFSINMLKVLRLPSLKICTILLMALFFYDIFFVFITPLFMPQGKSVMVEVATGGTSGEQLPMVLKVPHFNNDPVRVCYTPFSLLGFGDILVPGLLLSYCHSYDLLSNNRYKLYWSITSLAYILGLVMTFVSLFMMNSAQPALLYLVPFTLVPTILVAALRGDLANMWEGDFKGVVRKSVLTDSPGRHRNLEEEYDDEDNENGRDSAQEDVDTATERNNAAIAEGLTGADTDQHLTVTDQNKLINEK